LNKSTSHDWEQKADRSGNRLWDYHQTCPNNQILLRDMHRAYGYVHIRQKMVVTWFQTQIANKNALPGEYIRL